MLFTDWAKNCFRKFFQLKRNEKSGFCEKNNKDRFRNTKRKNQLGRFFEILDFTLFHRLYKLLELLRLFHRHLTQNFSINGDFFIGEFFDET